VEWAIGGCACGTKLSACANGRVSARGHCEAYTAHRIAHGNNSTHGDFGADPNQDATPHGYPNRLATAFRVGHTEPLRLGMWKEEDLNGRHHGF